MFHFLCFEIRGSNKLIRQPIELSGQRAAIEAVTAERFNRLSLPKEMIFLFPGPGWVGGGHLCLPSMAAVGCGRPAWGAVQTLSLNEGLWTKVCAPSHDNLKTYGIRYG